MAPGIGSIFRSSKKKKQPLDDFPGVDPRIFNESSVEKIEEVEETPVKPSYPDPTYSKKDFQKTYVPFTLELSDVFASRFRGSMTGKERFDVLRMGINGGSIKLEEYKTKQSDLEISGDQKFKILINNEIVNLDHLSLPDSFQHEIGGPLIKMYVDGSVECFSNLKKVVFEKGEKIKNNRFNLKYSGKNKQLESLYLNDSTIYHFSASSRNKLWDFYHEDAQYYFKNILFNPSQKSRLVYLNPVSKELAVSLQKRSKLYAAHFDYMIEKELDSLGVSGDVEYASLRYGGIF